MKNFVEVELPREDREKDTSIVYDEEGEVKKAESDDEVEDEQLEGGHIGVIELLQGTMPKENEVLEFKYFFICGNIVWMIFLIFLLDYYGKVISLIDWGSGAYITKLFIFSLLIMGIILVVHISYAMTFGKMMSEDDEDL